MNFRRLAIFVAVTGSAFLGLSSLAAASSSTIAFSIVNGAGRAQSWVTLSVNGQEFGSTGPGGVADIWGLNPGDVVTFTRAFSAHVASCDDQAPEGPGGIKYVVPASPPERATITLPTIIGSGALSDPPVQGVEEVVGYLNQLRKRDRLGPLEISDALEAAAQFEADKGYTCAHPVAAIDAGWPFGFDGFQYGGASIAGNLTTKGVATDLYENKGGDLSNPGAASIGVGRSGGVWVADLSGSCPDGFASACRMTGDFGHTPPPAPKDPQLKLLSVKQKGQRLQALFHLSYSAQGTFAISLSHGGRTRSYSATENAYHRTVQAHVSHGKYILRSQFTGTGAWPSASTCDVVKAKPYARRRWHRLRVRSCA